MDLPFCITQFEKIMNEGVDALAKSAAYANSVDSILSAKAFRRGWVTKYIQYMMVIILEQWIIDMKKIDEGLSSQVEVHVDGQQPIRTHDGDSDDEDVVELDEGKPAAREDSLKDKFHYYAWGNPISTQGGVASLPKPPKLLGLVKELNMIDERTTTFNQGVEFFAPVKWYLEQLKWSPERDPGQASELEHLGTTFTELMLDFTFSTHIHLRKIGKDHKLSCGQASSIFAFCAKRVGFLCKGRWRLCSL